MNAKNTHENDPNIALFTREPAPRGAALAIGELLLSGVAYFVSTALTGGAQEAVQAGSGSLAALGTVTFITAAVRDNRRNQQ